MQPSIPDPVLLVVAVFSRHAQAREWAAERLERHFGPAALASLPYPFTQTKYYEQSMGAGVVKHFLAFRDLIDPGCLPRVKRWTNDLEAELAASGGFPEPRPLNLDPGVLSLGKFLLATTKDQSHRIYLNDGIFAEVTLRYRDGAYEPCPWTYADYRQPLVLDFLLQARQYYRRRREETIQPASGIDPP